MIIKDNWNNNISDFTQIVSDYLSTAETFSVVDGGILDEFEQKVADFFHKKYCVAFCNGTAAIHAASYALFGTGSTVNIPKYSYFGAVNALLENRININIVDINSDSLLMDFTKKSSIVGDGNLMLTSVWGAGYSFDDLTEYKKQYPNAKILMDNSHAYGTLYKGMNISSCKECDICCYSMGKGKFVDAGELGIAITDNKNLAMQMMTIGHPNRLSKNKWFKGLSLDKNAIGNKYRPHSVAILLASVQLKRLEEKLLKNRQSSTLIADRLSLIDGISIQKQSNDIERCYWKIPIKVDTNVLEINMLKFRDLLSENGIPVLDGFQYSDIKNFNTWTDIRYEGQLMWNTSIPKNNYENWLLLPGYVDISENDAERFATSFTNALNGCI